MILVNQKNQINPALTDATNSATRRTLYDSYIRRMLLYPAQITGLRSDFDYFGVILPVKQQVHRTVLYVLRINLPHAIQLLNSIYFRVGSCLAKLV